MKIFIDNCEFKADIVVVSDKAISIRNLVPVIEKEEDKVVKVTVYSVCPRAFEINPESFI